MTRVLYLCGLVALLAGCGGGAGTAGGGGGDPDSAAVYEAVLKHEFPGENKDAEVFLSIDGADPAPELLDRLRKHLPKIEAGSKTPKGKATRLHVGELKAERDTAELVSTVSDGIDGRQRQVWLARKNGVWVVERTKTLAVS